MEQITGQTCEILKDFFPLFPLPQLPPILLRFSTHTQGSYEWVSSLQQGGKRRGKLWRRGNRYQNNSQTQHHHPTQDLDGLLEEEGSWRINISIWKGKTSFSLPRCWCIITLCRTPARIQTLKSSGMRTLQIYFGRDVAVPQTTTVSGHLASVQQVFRHLWLSALVCSCGVSSQLPATLFPLFPLAL